jgi:RimJ/RimL family protein N-acetyltransferase
VIGALVAREAAVRPERTVLRGRFVTLEPLDAAAHGANLYDATRGPEGDKVWLYLPYGPFPERALFETALQEKACSEDPLYFAIIENSTRLAVGHASYLRIKPEHRSIEVGHILYVPKFQRTAGATEAMYLMAKCVFDDLGYRRYEWKCNALNAASRKAALRLGFTFEGVFRQHMIIKGRNRDSAWFSMIDSEWPQCKSVFEKWLEPSNFDSHGNQRTSLSAIRERSISA